MSSFEYQMIKLDHLVLEADAASARLAAQCQRRREAINKAIPAPEATSSEDGDLLLDNIPI